MGARTVTCTRDVQPLKQFCGILVTVEGMVMLSNEVHPKKEHIVSSPSGSSTVLSEVHCSNIKSPTFFKDAGSLISFWTAEQQQEIAIATIMNILGFIISSPLVGFLLGSQFKTFCSFC